MFFDENGCRRGVRGIGKRYYLSQPKFDEKDDFAKHFFWLRKCLNRDVGNTAEEFEVETKRLLSIIRNNPQIVNILNDIYLPVILFPFVQDDLGAELELCLTGLERSYLEIFGDRSFTNFCQGNLKGRVSAIEGSRHDQLIKKLKKGPVIGIHFPNVLQGFSIDAAREQISRLPKGFILSGIDTVYAKIIYPELLTYNSQMLGYDLAALHSCPDNYSFSFGIPCSEICGLPFGYIGDLTRARNSFSSSLLFIDN